MSSEDMLLKQLDRVRSDAMSHHLQRPAEKICSSSVTLNLKSEGRSVDDSDLLINEVTETQPKENVLWNGSVENCNSERVIRTIEAISNGTHKMEFLSGFDALAVLDASCTSHLQSAPISALDTACKVEGTSPDFNSSLDPIQSSCPLGTSSEKLQWTSGQNASRVLHVADQPTDTSAPFDQEGVLDPAPIQSSQPISSVPTHNRNLSQTTSQLTNLKESTKSENFEDTCHGSNLLQGLHVKKLPDTCPVNKSGMEDRSDVPSSGSLIVDKPQIILSDSCDLRTIQDLTSSTDHNTGSDISHVSEETVFETLPDPFQCSNLESKVDERYLTHSPYPDWKLDRRESGHLYWRRDSSTLNGTDPSNRVKFRYDIEIHEFESRSSGAEDLAEEDDDNAYYYDDDSDDMEFRNVDKLSVPNSQTPVNRKEESSSLGSTAVMCIVAMTAIIVMASYRWLWGILSPI